jgi:diadenylate cyclase
VPSLHMNFLQYLQNGLDILLVWFVIYRLIIIIQGTKAVQLLKGVTIIIVVKVLSSLFGLHTLQFLMDQALTWGFLAVIIIFQPELRRALEQLGRGRFFSRTSPGGVNDRTDIVESIAKATEYMAKRRIGALISFERQTGMGDYIESGIPLNANLSSELLINIFIPNTPLHDGAVIIQGEKITAAACYLPLSESAFISKELGTRHRAAVGISEVTDSITIVVSEETGAVSVARNGNLYRELSKDELVNLLNTELKSPEESTTSKWNWKVKRNG